MVSVDQVYMIGHMKNADGSINNKNVVLSAACEAAELFQCMLAVHQKLEDWQRFNHTLEMHLRSVECCLLYTSKEYEFLRGNKKLESIFEEHLK